MNALWLRGRVEADIKNTLLSTVVDGFVYNIAATFFLPFGRVCDLEAAPASRAGNASDEERWAGMMIPATGRLPTARPRFPGNGRDNAAHCQVAPAVTAPGPTSITVGEADYGKGDDTPRGRYHWRAVDRPTRPCRRTPGAASASAACRAPRQRARSRRRR